MNEYGVGLAESTCVGIFQGNASASRLNIVDLSELALERTKVGCDIMAPKIGRQMKGRRLRSDWPDLRPTECARGGGDHGQACTNLRLLVSEEQ